MLYNTSGFYVAIGRHDRVFNKPLMHTQSTGFERMVTASRVKCAATILGLIDATLTLGSGSEQEREQQYLTPFCTYVSAIPLCLDKN